jgi:pimeloyl-ACP methyl ester carboxylesterase
VPLSVVSRSALSRLSIARSTSSAACKNQSPQDSKSTRELCAQFPGDTQMAIRKGYVDTADGQVHYRHCAGGSGAPIVFFHMTASSSACYVNMLNRLDGTRPLYAFDTPHYGQSFVPTKPPSIAYIASIIREALTNLGVDKFHAFGQHTGTNIAAELAVTVPERVLSLSLNGCSHFSMEEGAKHLETLCYDNPITVHGGQLISAWTRVVKDVEPAPINAAFAHQEVIDTLTAGADWHWGYRAVFVHDMPRIMARVKCPIFLNCARQDYAYYSHRYAVAALPHAVVHECDEHGCYYISIGVDDLAPPLIDFINKVAA